MAEEATVETTTTQESGAGETLTPHAGGQAAEPQTDVMSGGDGLAELESLRAALKKANSESAARRIKLEEYEQAERERQEAELSETEKLKKKLAEAQTASERAAEEMRNIRIRHAVEMTAASMQFYDPADAFVLANLSGVAVEEGGAVTGVEDALKALAKSKPHLVKGAERPSDLNTQNRTNGATPISEDDAKRIASVFGVRPDFVVSEASKVRR